MVDIRVGQGFDIHRFADTPIEGRVLILGGVAFPGEPVLVGHSDADVIAHAAADALLGAAGLATDSVHGGIEWFATTENQLDSIAEILGFEIFRPDEDYE